MPAKKHNDYEELGASHASTQDDEGQLANELKLNNLKFDFEYASFQSMDDFYPVGSERHLKDDKFDKLGFTNIYAQTQKRINEYIFEEDMFRDSAAAGSQNQSIPHNENEQASNDEHSESPTEACDFDTIADLTMTNKHPVH